MNKSEAACRLACQHLREIAPVRYLWTFTFPRTQADWWCGRTFSALWRAWQRRLGAKGCIKVVELHPGGHGVHFHVLVDRRYPVTVLRAIAGECGFGRVHVLTLGEDNDGGYVAKYLTKGQDKLHGVCRYGVLGEWRFGRVRDVEIQSEAARRLRVVWELRREAGELPTIGDVQAAIGGGDDWLRRLSPKGRRPGSRKKWAMAGASGPVVQPVRVGDCDWKRVVCPVVVEKKTSRNVFREVGLITCGRQAQVAPWAKREPSPVKSI